MRVIMLPGKHNTKYLNKIKLFVRISNLNSVMMYYLLFPVIKLYIYYYVRVKKKTEK